MVFIFITRISIATANFTSVFAYIVNEGEVFLEVARLLKLFVTPRLVTLVPLHTYIVNEGEVRLEVACLLKLFVTP
tara:strand:- start:419 stop:646 length:228 start_codon:yes stop_codon:yes gene_type:complete